MYFSTKGRSPSDWFDSTLKHYEKRFHYSSSNLPFDPDLTAASKNQRVQKPVRGTGKSGFDQDLQVPFKVSKVPAGKTMDPDMLAPPKKPHKVQGYDNWDPDLKPFPPDPTPRDLDT
jgi:hypothetical protein